SAPRPVRADLFLQPRGVARLDGVPDARLELHAVEPVDLLQARRGGDVDLREVRADDVDAHEDEAAGLQRPADGFADLALARPRPGSRHFTPGPPPCGRGRPSPPGGPRLRAPAGSPSIRMMRLSPCRTSGM